MVYNCRNVCNCDVLFFFCCNLCLLHLLQLILRSRPHLNADSLAPAIRLTTAVWTKIRQFNYILCSEFFQHCLSKRNDLISLTARDGPAGGTACIDWWAGWLASGSEAPAAALAGCYWIQKTPGWPRLTCMGGLHTSIPYFISPIENSPPILPSSQPSLFPRAIRSVYKNWLPLLISLRGKRCYNPNQSRSSDLLGLATGLIIL